MTVTLNPLYRFDTFVVGSANRLAMTAARAVAESPGTVYNPLFIYARPGLGKTHLLMGLGHAARAIDPNLQVEYLTLDEFVEAFHAAIAAGHGEAYRKRFLDVDLLLVDDVQFLTHRREMQAELLRLTDALQTTNRQIVLTSDRPPAEIEALDERLIRRFAGGLIIDVSAPDYDQCRAGDAFDVFANVEPGHPAQVTFQCRYGSFALQIVDPPVDFGLRCRSAQPALHGVLCPVEHALGGDVFDPVIDTGSGQQRRCHTDQGLH
jgi:hypothetical protein